MLCIGKSDAPSLQHCFEVGGILLRDLFEISNYCLNDLSSRRFHSI